MKLSVITINYNNREGLEHTINSVIQQKFDDYEYIIVDGNSIDGSKEVILFNNQYIDFWISEADEGIYSAMNKGIDRARGQYCIFMNSGDCFYDENVLAQISTNLDGTDIIYGDTKYTDGFVRKSINEPPLLSFFYVNSFSHQSTFIRTELLQLYRYDENLKIVADWKFFLQTLIIDNCSFKQVNFFIAIYDVTGISSTNKVLYEEERSRVLKQMFTDRILKDYEKLLHGVMYDEKLYIEMRRSKYRKYFYLINICIIKLFSFFKKGSSWINKYPFDLK